MKSLLLYVVPPLTPLSELLNLQY